MKIFRRIAKPMALLGGVGVLLVAGRSLAASLGALAEWTAGLGLWAPAAFAVLYAFATVLLVPGSVLTLAAGATLGLMWGTVSVFVGATAGAVACFLISRHLARDVVERKIASDERFIRIDRAVTSNGLRLLFLLRLSPVVPFNFLNYGSGLMAVRFKDYAIACLGMLPGTILYVYYGKLAGDVAALAGGTAANKGSEYYMVMALGLAATIAVTFLVTRMTRAALSEVTSAPAVEVSGS